MRWPAAGATAWKPRRVILWAGAVSMLLMIAVFSLLDFAHRRQESSREAQLLSELTASRIESALSRHDIPAAVQMLKNLRAEHRVIAAFLYGPHGRVLGYYTRAGSGRPFTAPPIRPDGDYRAVNVITSFRPIRPDAFADTRQSASAESNGSQAARLGTLGMQFDVGGFFESWEPLARFTVMLLVLSLAMAVLFSRRMQLAVSDPILDLTQTALRVTSERQYHNLFDKVPDPVFITDRQSYKFLYANETASRVYGYRFEEFLRMSPLDLHSPDDRRPALSSVDRDKPIARFNTVHLARDGRRMDVEILSSPIVYEDRSAWLTIARDVTVRTQVQMELERAKADAEDASRAKSEFLANMSHEIRTPMNGILGMIALALDTPLNAEQREYIALAKTSADSLLSLLNDILDFSKIEAGKLEFEHIPFPLRDELGEKMKPLGHLASRKGIELVWRIRPSVPDHVVGDPARLRQILFNLVGNAIKFTEKGGVLVDIALESASPEGALLHFLVRDTGIGIPIAQQERIFDAFTQADSSTTRKFGGTGLGLAVVNRLVERMGGRIWVESDVGRGSSFHFTARLGLPAGHCSPPANPPAALDGLRVLVADDHMESRLILVEMLKHWRMESEEAESAAAAVEALRRAQARGRPFHLAIVDAQMPGADSSDWIERIGDNRDFDPTRLILLGSFGQPEKSNSRASAFLSKPVQQSELLDTILKVSTGAGAEEASAVPGPATGRPVPAAGRRALLAEDNAVNQRLAARLLEKQGYSVETANDGGEALELFSRRPYDLILMDVQMPLVDGLEATRMIRERERPTGSRVPVVILTAHAMKGDRERCLAAGADDYLAKPIDPCQLAAVLDRLTVPDAKPKASAFASAHEPEQPFDSKMVLERLEGDRGLLAEMIRLFDEEAPNLVHQAHAALNRADFPSLQKVAHTLRGAIGNFGAGPAFRCAEELDAAARADASAPAANALQSLENQLRQLAEAFEPFRAGILK